jgi:hypothetical protein
MVRAGISLGLIVFLLGCSSNFKAKLPIVEATSVASRSLCEPGFTEFQNACFANSKTCTVQNGTGTQSFSNGSYGACITSTCSSGFTLFNNTCFATTQACTIGNVSGTRTFTNGNYGPCFLNSCNAGFTFFENVCHANTQNCSVLNGSGTQSFSNGSYGTCVASNCNSGFTLFNNLCFATTVTCNIGNDTGTKTFLNGSYGACVLNSCNVGFTLFENVCHANSQSCPITNGTGSQSFSNGSYGTCVASSCNTGFVLSGNNCVAALPTIVSNPAVKVMDNTSTGFSYFFSATRISGASQSYLAVFDAEVYNAPVGSVGDSTGAKYGSAFNFGTHAGQNDIAISRSNLSSGPTNSNGAITSWDGPSQYMNGGASNPQLIQIGGNWAFYWLNVKQDAAGNYHHYMLMSWFGDSFIGNIFGADMRTLQTNDTFDVTTGLVNQPVQNAGPVFDEAGGPVMNKFGTPNPDATNGLIGSMTTDPDGTVYFYYTDYENGRSGIYRRAVRSFLTWMSAPELIADLGAGQGGMGANINVNYHADLKKYVVIHNCNHDFYYDFCVKLFDTKALTGFNLAADDHTKYGINLPNDPAFPKFVMPDGSMNNVVIQPGIRKNGQGQHFTDQDGQIIIYLPVARSGSAWDIRSVYAKVIEIK